MAKTPKRFSIILSPRKTVVMGRTSKGWVPIYSVVAGKPAARPAVLNPAERNVLNQKMKSMVAAAKKRKANLARLKAHANKTRVPVRRKF